MDIKLIGIDIDGTLVNSQKLLTPATKEAIELAGRQGIEVVISTGRFLSEYQYLLDQLPSMRYTVSCTGAQVLNVKKGETLFRKALTADQLRYIYSKLSDLDVFLQIFSDLDGKAHNRADLLLAAERYCGAELGEMLRQAHVAEEDLDGYVASYSGLTNKVHMFFADENDRQTAFFRMKDEPFSVLSSCSNDLEIMPFGVDKGLGMQKLAEYLGLQAEQVMALGDGDNDIAMLRYAGLGIAMANASEAAKAAADRVLPYTNDEDGVAKAILSIL